MSANVFDLICHLLCLLALKKMTMYVGHLVGFSISPISMTNYHETCLVLIEGSISATWID